MTTAATARRRTTTRPRRRRLRRHSFGNRRPHRRTSEARSRAVEARLEKRQGAIRRERRGHLEKTLIEGGARDAQLPKGDGGVFDDRRESSFDVGEDGGGGLGADARNDRGSPLLETGDLLLTEKSVRVGNVSRSVATRFEAGAGDGRGRRDKRCGRSRGSSRDRRSGRN